MTASRARNNDIGSEREKRHQQSRASGLQCSKHQFGLI
jgi:hypothetical protein